MTRYEDQEATSTQRGFLLVVAFALLAFGLVIALSGCANRPIKVSGGWGPHGSIDVGRETEPFTATQPPKGVAIIAAGEGVNVNAQVQVGAMQSVQSSVTNQTPVGWLDKLFGGGGPPKDPDPPQ